MRHFDVLIIGGGQAAFPLTRDLVAAGKSVAIAERKHLGGSCVNFGCTPTKAAIASATLAHDARRAGEFGLHVAGVEVHFASVLTRARGVAQESREGLEDEFAHKDNPKILRGHGRFSGVIENGYQVTVGDETVSAEVVVLDVGSRSNFPEVPGLAETTCLHAGNWMDNAELPARLAVLGGGVIALEMCQFYRRMGSQVTVFEASERILQREDPDIADALRRHLENEKIAFHTNAKIESVTPIGNGISLKWAGQAEEFDNIFVATGRRPNTDGLDLHVVGIETTERGMIKVDERLRSNLPSIYAVGDIRGGPQFTHTSWDDYRVVKSQLLGDGSRTTTGRVVPYALFTDPELGRVGLTESEARKQGINLKVGKFDMTHNGAARERRNRAGFIKVLVDADRNRMVGAAILAREAGEMIELLSAMMALDADYRVVRDSVVTHPTYMEAVQSALEAVG